MLYLVSVEDEFDGMYIAPKYMSFSKSDFSFLTLNQSMSSCSLYQHYLLSLI